MINVAVGTPRHINDLSGAPTRGEAALYQLADLALRGGGAVALVEQAAALLGQVLGDAYRVVVEHHLDHDRAVMSLGETADVGGVTGAPIGAEPVVDDGDSRDLAGRVEVLVGDHVWGRVSLESTLPGRPPAEVTSYLDALAIVLGAGLEHAARQRAGSPSQLLRRSLVEQASVFDLITEAVLIHDLPTGGIRFWNRGAERLYGWTRDEVIGHSAHQRLQTAWSRPLLEAAPAQPLAAILAALIRADGWAGELVQRRRDGGALVVASRWTVLWEAAGQPLAILETNIDITAHQLVAETQASLAAIVESSDDAIYIRRLDGTITSWNPGAERLYGYTAEEVIGHSYDRLVPPERADELRAILERLGRGEPIPHFEAVRLGKDGRRLDVSLSISPIRDGAGRVASAAVIARDITERQRARAAQALLVRASAILATSLDDELTLRGVAHLVVPTLADACLVDLVTETHTIRRLAVAATRLTQPDTAGTLASASVIRSAAAQPELAVLQPGRSVLVTEATDRLLAGLSQAIAPVTAGWTRPALGAMIVPLVARGRPLGALTLITARPEHRYGPTDLSLAEELAGRAALAVDNAHLYREAQRALARERAARGRAEALAAERVAVLRQIADGVLIVDPAGHVTFANEAAHQLFGGITLGVAASHATAAQVLTLDGQPWPPATRPITRAARQGETVVDAQLRLRRPDGAEVIVECSAVPVVAEDGRRLGAVTTLRDVTTRYQFERQKDEFFTNISHDLRTPLAGIKASIGVVLAYPSTELPAPLRRLLGNINQTVDQATALVNDLLELARVQAGQVEVEREPGDLRAVVRRAVRMIEPLARARGQAVRLSLPRRPVIVEVDAARLERAVLNLLSNAQTHGRAGGQIHVRVTCQSDAAVIDVIDDGPGVAVTDQPHIFERFYRGETTRTRRRPGSGLGLAIAKAMVDLHGGRIWVTSTPGAGATFSIAVPLATTHAIGKDESR